MSLAIAGPMTLAIAPAGGPMRVAIGMRVGGSVEETSKAYVDHDRARLSADACRRLR